MILGGREGPGRERGGVEIREAVSGTGRDGRELLTVRISKKKNYIGGWEDEEQG